MNEAAARKDVQSCSLGEETKTNAIRLVFVLAGVKPSPLHSSLYRLTTTQQENELNTTLNQIRDKSPCAYGWKKLLAHLGKTRADDEPLSITMVLESNGLDDALWCLQAVKGFDREIRIYAVWCARQVQHLMTDPRSLAALDVAERFANSEATDDELAAARDAAGAAAWAPAWSAAWDAAGAAAWAAAWDAARDSARDAQEARLRELCAEIDAKA